MTREEFNNTRWGAGMKCRVITSWQAEYHEVLSVNFGEALVGLDKGNDINNLWWYRCESVELCDD